MARTLHERVKQDQFESPAQEAVLNLLVTACHYRQRLNDICRSHQITHDQYNVLRILKGVYPAGHPRNEIIGRMIERTPDVTRLLDRLEKRGLVCRTTSREDRRLSIAKITDRGLALLEQMNPKFSRASKEATEGISEADLAAFSAVSSAMLENMQH